MDSALTWFEIPVSDINSGKTFYERVFKMEMRDMQVKDEKLAIFPAQDLSGALIEEQNYQAPKRGMIIYLNIPDSIEGVLDRVAAAGGQVETPRTDISEEVGWSATFRDIDGNLIGLYEAAAEN